MNADLWTEDELVSYLDTYGLTLDDCQELLKDLHKRNAETGGGFTLGGIKAIFLVR